MRNISIFMAPFVVLMLIGLANGMVSKCQFPSYGIWTGIRPLENKIKLFDEFSKEGAVDATIFGSSIADFGFSSEKYSKLMSSFLGRPYRAFNFATGGAELTTILQLYKISRVLAQTKEIILVMPAQWKRSNQISIYSPDHLLNLSPIGNALDNPTLLKIQKKIWSMPIIDKAPALRDSLLFGDLTLVGEGMDTYEVNSYGDRISFGAIKDNDKLMSLRDIYIANISPYNELNSNSHNKLEHFFPQVDIDAMFELRQLAKKDGVKLTIFAHGSAATFIDLPIDDIEYKLARSQYFEVMANELGAELVMKDDIAIPSYGVMEDTHLNHHGAILYTQQIFEQRSKSEIKLKKVKINDPLKSILNDDQTFNSWSAVINNKQGPNKNTLRCRFVNSIAVPDFPLNDLYFALRMTDGSDIIVPAVKVGKSTYEGQFDLEDYPKVGVLVFRLLYGTATNLRAIPSPLAAYEWVK